MENSIVNEITGLIIFALAMYLVITQPRLIIEGVKELYEAFNQDISK